MGNLANKKIGDSYKDLLQISNNNSGVDGTVRFIESGNGTQSVLGLDTSKITIDGHILPTTNAAYDLGSAEKKIRHLYLSDNSLFVGDVQLSSTDASNVKDLGAGTYATTAAMNAGMATKADTTVMLNALLGHPTHIDLTNGLATKADVSALDDCLKSNASDVFSGKLSVSNTNLRSAGVYGIYDSYKIGHIWSMGTSYSIPDTGSDFGTLYGFAYKHVNNTTGGTMAGGHQAVWCENGIPNVAIGTNLWAKNNITAYSDARVKKNIETIPDAVDKVKAIRGVTYDRIDSSEGVGKQMGVIAQELVDVIPEVVTGGPTDDDPGGHYSVAYGNIVGLLIEAIKEQQDQLEEQKQLINQLLNR